MLKTVVSQLTGLKSLSTGPPIDNASLHGSKDACMRTRGGKMTRVCMRSRNSDAGHVTPQKAIPAAAFWASVGLSPPWSRIRDPARSFVIGNLIEKKLRLNSQRQIRWEFQCRPRTHAKGGQNVQQDSTMRRIGMGAVFTTRCDTDGLKIVLSTPFAPVLELNTRACLQKLA